MNDELLSVLSKCYVPNLKKSLDDLEKETFNLSVDELKILYIHGYLPTGIYNYLTAIRVKI